MGAVMMIERGWFGEDLSLVSLFYGVKCSNVGITPKNAVHGMGLKRDIVSKEGFRVGVIS